MLNRGAEYTKIAGGGGETPVDHTMAEQSSKVFELAQPLLRSHAFQRLNSVTFLGILSPKFSWVPDYPFKRIPEGAHDGTRADHSFEVARLLFSICESFNFSAEIKKYAVAWALLHDIATWPLSHTGEPAFSAITETDPSLLRQSIISGKPKKLPTDLTVTHALRSMRIDVATLMLLFDRNLKQQNPPRSFWRILRSLIRAEQPTLLSRSHQFLILRDIIHSPLTPDTLEGMSRAAHIFNIKIPRPFDVADSMYRDLFGAQVHQEKSNSLLAFWRAKSDIYRKWINKRAVVDFESRWSVAIRQSFSGIRLPDSLELDEMAIVSEVIKEGIPHHARVTRYKPPHSYRVASHYKRKKILTRDYNVDELKRILEKSKRD